LKGATFGKIDNAMAGGFKKYDLPFILKTLSILNMNDYDVQKTAIATGVFHNTIKRWASRYSTEYKQQIQELMTGKAAVDMSQSMQLYREEAKSEIDKVKDMIISKMKEIIPKTRSLDQLSRAYKIMHECTTGIDDGATQDKSYLQIINMQINAMQGKLEEQTKDTEYEPTDD